MQHEMYTQEVRVTESGGADAMMLNPWQPDAAEASFGPHLRKLMSNLPPIPPPASASSEEGVTPTATNNDEDRDDDPFIQKLRAADRRCTATRRRQLQTKVAVIQAEVASILSPAALAELEAMLGQIASRMGPIADRAALENLTADYLRKKDEVCVRVEVENQHKIKALFDFVANLRALEDKSEASRRAVNSGSSGGSGKGSTSGTDGDGIGNEDPNDVVRPAALALHCCDRIVHTDRALQAQYALLLDFHKEFKDHIFKGV